MRSNRGPGKFIVIEGLDGAGTTTQARLLGQGLASRGPTWVTWEPSNRPAGMLIRRFLAGELATDPRSLALLFAADRLDHVYGPDGILEHLRRGEHVVCDRYYLSSLAYQTLDASFAWVYQINRYALRPDLTVFLDVPVAVCLERIGGRQGGRKELFEREEALRQVRARYARAVRHLARREHIQVVDGCGSIAQVADMVEERAMALLDPTLITAPSAILRLGRQAPSLAAFQRLLREQDGFSIRGVRPTAHEIEVLVDTAAGRRPLRVRFPRSGGEATVEAPPEANDRAAALLEEWARRAQWKKTDG